MVTLRKANIWDAVKISELWQQMTDEVPYLKSNNPDKERFYLQLLVRIKHPHHCIIVAESAGEIIGFITGYLTNAEYSDKVIGFCDNAFCDPRYRGHNVYFKMIDELYSEGVRAGAKEMDFQFRYDPNLVKVWQRKGYEPSFIVYSREVK